MRQYCRQRTCGIHGEPQIEKKTQISNFNERKQVLRHLRKLKTAYTQFEIFLFKHWFQKISLFNDIIKTK